MTQAVEVTADLVASVVRVERARGDHVTRGDVLLVVESMKMEIPVRATADGVVRELEVTAGDVVTEGDVLAVIALESS
ncbi:MAG: biotin/lipoyl-binding carrier protein [Egibacteraceae bacterium]